MTTLSQLKENDCFIVDPHNAVQPSPPVGSPEHPAEVLKFLPENNKGQNVLGMTRQRLGYVKPNTPVIVVLHPGTCQT
jgi:hypothetical protein